MHRPGRLRPPRGAFVGERDAQAPVQQGQFPEPLLQCGERTLLGVEDLGVGPEGEGGAAARGPSPGGGRSERDTARVLLDPARPLPAHLGRQAARQRVGDGGPDAEGSQDRGVPVSRIGRERHAGQQRFEAGTFRVPGGLDGDARAVVGDPHSAVVGERDVDVACPARQDRVHRPPGDFEHHLPHAAFTGRTDVHAGPLADGVPCFAHPDATGLAADGPVTHESPSPDRPFNTPSLRGPSECASSPMVPRHRGRTVAGLAGVGWSRGARHGSNTPEGAAEAAHGAFTGDAGPSVFATSAATSGAGGAPAYPQAPERARHRSRRSAISAMWWMNSRLSPATTPM